MSLKILISAYAYRPDKGSEPAISWNLVRELVKFHQIWVITRENNREAVESSLKERPINGLTVIYCRLPHWLEALNRNQRIVQVHYYLWQIAAYFQGKHLHDAIPFDLVHHVTYVKYWGPSFLALLPIPFIWGPVGGGESAPKSFWRDFGKRGKIYEILRDLGRSLGERDPFVRITARRSVLARATTEDTAARLRVLGAPRVEVLSQLGLSDLELDRLGRCPVSDSGTIRFLSIGRLLHWKGFHLGLRAFAAADLPENTEYWIVGDGPERDRLAALATELGIGDRVTFWGALGRDETLDKLGDCVALVHPSLHESGGLVCLEAMAARRPVLCLQLGGPGLQVTPETGIAVPAETPERAVTDLAEAMSCVAGDRALRLQMGETARQRAIAEFSWSAKVRALAQLYDRLALSQPEVANR
ncbi:glycosyltransferase family 4 protein [Oxynema aestuarii]|uniref:Glycosyltransferase family 4 protein n=1 Tax=Oxynema aestuarii AP17 TaxID=2064643 RepID=A0A6H1U0L3_9CYAN|nr:glycosyltransferase family 4 protein [Oxynema aestuarii]QIZ72402.1 glycosyltransferase family 4 protein [Oxynema aestuarii AP17]RMH78454.1 MAG: glycosyltransferase [Cyanobacteria bacterium J007]